MTAKEILKLIETVSPDDTAKLDEIDARVDCYLANDHGHHFITGITFLRMRPDIGEGSYECDRKQEGAPPKALFTPEKYTRSRDKLKEIRPENPMISMRGSDKTGYIALMFDMNKMGMGDCYYCPTPELKTEELAELHCIIQAIAHERGEEV